MNTEHERQWLLARGYSTAFNKRLETMPAGQVHAIYIRIANTDRRDLLEPLPAPRPYPRTDTPAFRQDPLF